jgi:hypothetical protein
MREDGGTVEVLGVRVPATRQCQGKEGKALEGRSAVLRQRHYHHRLHGSGTAAKPCILHVQIC